MTIAEMKFITFNAQDVIATSGGGNSTFIAANTKIRTYYSGDVAFYDFIGSSYAIYSLNGIIQKLKGIGRTIKRGIIYLTMYH